MGIYNIINTILGPIILVAKNNQLIGVYWLNQILKNNDVDKNNLSEDVQLSLVDKYKESFLESTDDHLLTNTELQLKEYFSGQRQKFSLPICLIGTEFQMKTWEELKNIPFGETRSYLDQSIKLKKPKAYRAVGTANSKNPISIIIPCHRVVGNNGALSGYAGGIDKKSALLQLEREFSKLN